MPNMNSYTYMHNHKVLHDKPNETGINNCNCRNKDACPLLNSCQTKSIIYQTNIYCDSSGYLTLAHVKQHLKIIWGIIKSEKLNNETFKVLSYIYLYLLLFYVVALIIKVLNANCFQQSDLHKC